MAVAAIGSIAYSVTPLRDNCPERRQLPSVGQHVPRYAGTTGEHAMVEAPQ